MNDVKKLARASPENRAIDRAPIAYLEFPTFAIRPADVVLLQSHDISNAPLAHSHERCAQIAHTRRISVVRVVGKGIEDAASHDLIPTRHGRGEISIAR